MRTRNLSVLLVSGLLVLTGTQAAVARTDAPEPDVVEKGARSAPPGSLALSGEAARTFALPADLELLHTTTYPDGRTSSRYQQRFRGASVLGSQITVLRAPTGTNLAVVGRYASNLRPTNAVRISPGAARRAVTGKIGGQGRWSQELRLDPATGAFFYEVRSQRKGTAPVRWVDAARGKITRSLNLRRSGEGPGVKGDHKTFPTSKAGKSYLLRSADGRFSTYDAQNRPSGRVLMADGNDLWNQRADWISPDQRAGVDAQYYQSLVHRYYSEIFNRDSVDGNGAPLESTVHVGTDYCQAFWDGSSAWYGDGHSGRAARQERYTCRPLSGALDVVAHELTHGVVQHTSQLWAGAQPLALNEGIADIMGASVEFYAAAHGLDPAAPADWGFGEDVVASRTPAPGFRNLAEPRLNGALDHYSQYAEQMGPHAGGTIAGHAFYLAAAGGTNSGCTASATHQPTHTADCAVDVPAIGQARATQIFYEAFTSLQETATFCEARNASVAVAGAQAEAVSLAWDAVGLHEGCVPGEPPPPPPPPPPAPCPDVSDLAVPFGSPHPYDNNMNCTWAYDNGTPGFAFHFSAMDLEPGFDFVHVVDGDGNRLGSYSGSYPPDDIPLICIPTSIGSVQLVTDSSIRLYGFDVDGVVPC